MFATYCLAASICGAGVVTAADKGFQRAHDRNSRPKETSSTERVPSRETNSVQAVVERARRAVVLISQSAREGRSQSVGSGFIVAPEGLIVTSLHVIGEGRPLWIQLENGKRYQPTGIHAWDRKLDLAVIKINATNLPVLPLGDSDGLQQGFPMVAIGNPLGLEYSVVQGVVSARREVDGIEMIQLAIPIEPGNSGGPILDLEGRVHGILNFKSLLTPNLGFALPVNRLKPLLTRPNPISIERWLAIGRLNPEEWLPLGGAYWSQKAGRIQVQGWGHGFAGRSVCLYQKPIPGEADEASVLVRLSDESGAAGLVFWASDAEKYHAFYPTAGTLRLTRFDGEALSTWQILEQVQTPHYRAHEWNRLRVKVDGTRISCYVNNHQVISVETTNRPPSMSRFGLGKFRHTEAMFHQFQVGTQLQDALAQPSREWRAALEKELGNEGATPDPAAWQIFLREPELSETLLREEAAKSERQAIQLKNLARAVHRTSVEKELIELLSQREEDIDLFYAALLIAKWDNSQLEVGAYREEVRGMAAEIQSKLLAGEDRIEALKKYLFQENGYHGSRTDYYNRAHSHINEVIDNREGLPITLSVLFIELGRRLGVENLAGIPLPGHFIVAHIRPEKQKFIDVFDEGKELTRTDLASLVRRYTGEPLRAEQLIPATKRQILARILRNLRAASDPPESAAEIARCLDLILLIDPEAAGDRAERAALRLRMGDNPGAKQDLKWLLDRQPEGVRLDELLELYRSL